MRANSGDMPTVRSLKLGDHVVRSVFRVVLRISYSLRRAFVA